MSRVRSLVVGSGLAGRAQLKALGELSDRVEVVGIVDSEPRLLAELRNGRIPAYSELGEALRQARPNLVHLCTPPTLHCQQVLESFSAGAHVYCEKPLCSSLAEADRIRIAEQETGQWCVGVCQWRFGSAAQHLRRLVVDGSIGRFLIGSASTMFFRDDAYYAAPWRGEWRNEVGGVTTGLGIHCIDLCLWLFGKWHEVSAMVGTLRHEIDVEDASVGITSFESGALLALVNSTVSPSEQAALRFDFEDATIECQSGHSYANRDWLFSPREQIDGQSKLWPPSEDVPNTHAAQLTALLDDLYANRRPDATTEDVRDTLEFLASFYKAAATGDRIRRGAITPGDPFYEHQAGTLCIPDAFHETHRAASLCPGPSERDQ